MRIYSCCLGFPSGSEVKASARNAGDPGSIPGSGRSPGEGNGNPLQYSCLENPMDRRAWLARVHGVAKSRTRLSNFMTMTIAVTRGLLKILQQSEKLQMAPHSVLKFIPTVGWVTGRLDRLPKSKRFSISLVSGSTSMNFTKRKIFTKFTKFLLKRKLVGKVASPLLRIRDGFVKMSCSLRPEGWGEVSWMEGQGNC